MYPANEYEKKTLEVRHHEDSGSWNWRLVVVDKVVWPVDRPSLEGQERKDSGFGDAKHASGNRYPGRATGSPDLHGFYYF